MFFQLVAKIILGFNTKQSLSHCMYCTSSRRGQTSSILRDWSSTATCPTSGSHYEFIIPRFPHKQLSETYAYERKAFSRLRFAETSCTPSHHLHCFLQSSPSSRLLSSPPTGIQRPAQAAPKAQPCFCSLSGLSNYHFPSDATSSLCKRIDLCCDLKKKTPL